MDAYLNGKKPPTNICTRVLWYQGAGGISRAMFLERQGASNPPPIFLPIMPPSIVSGNPTKEIEREYALCVIKHDLPTNHVNMINRIVVNGSA